MSLLDFLRRRKAEQVRTHQEVISEAVEAIATNNERRIGKEAVALACDALGLTATDLKRRAEIRREELADEALAAHYAERGSEMRQRAAEARAARDKRGSELRRLDGLVADAEMALEEARDRLSQASAAKDRIASRHRAKHRAALTSRKHDRSTLGDREHRLKEEIRVGDVALRTVGERVIPEGGLVLELIGRVHGIGDVEKWRKERVKELRNVEESIRQVDAEIEAVNNGAKPLTPVVSVDDDEFDVSRELSLGDGIPE